jgi:hypothetical protein
MCAAVAFTPLVVTLPDTAPLSAIVMVPSPLADVVTGGTSFAPESLSFTSALNAAPAPKVTIETIAVANIDFPIRFMNFLLER